MATYTGQTGVIKMDNTSGTVTAIAEVTAFSIEHTVNTIESTAMGDQYRQYRTGVNEWSGSADIFFTDTDISNFGNVLVGDSAGALSASTVTIEAFPGSETGNTYPKLSGEVVVTGFAVSSEMEGMVTATISFQGTGALTMAMV